MPEEKPRAPLNERSPILHTLNRTHALMQEARAYDRILPLAFLIGVLCALIWYRVFAAPADFTAPTIVPVTPNMTLEQITDDLQAQHIVRSGAVLKAVLRLAGANTTVRAGSYFFASPDNLFVVARRLAHGDFELTPARVTVKAAENAQAIAADLAQKLAPFDEEGFLNAALPREGYLYPDTYYFLPGEDSSEVAGALQKNFENHVAPITNQIVSFGKPLQADVIMASILVGEANTDHDRRVVAGILWHRLSLNMPLQVDATFGYILDKNLNTLTAQDVQTNSPYNTYQNLGLPPSPINNPPADAILQAVTPIKTNYLYYLSDPQGNMHYSVTYAQQKAKVQLYYGK